ncbi:MAG: TIGR04282 family arsenosugar biosynthesis glycosyltransferase [Gammaproteobacteria bacterium]|nr:TIGR04282 family arsenosugar biosynthesis glycosyltransferase [Gammaproteobacteria bacterium]MDH5731548.1 TIGR04282 family arsenosugar biosynthesis glycosyltransferase [Gammaproteobacteria bacterium]
MFAKIQNAIIVFAKAPIAGYSKTRLIPFIGADAASKLQEQFIQRTLKTVCSDRDWTVYLFTTPHSEFPVFQEWSTQAGLLFRQQITGDLGQRMANAFAQIKQCHDRVIIIGTDCPDLNVAALHQGFACLDHDDVVIFPAEDGGYVGLGLKSLMPGIFRNIDWSTEKVLQQTMERIKQVGATWHLMPELWDVDNYEDYKRFEKLLQNENSLSKFKH